MAIEGYEVITHEWTNANTHSYDVTLTAPAGKVILSAGAQSIYPTDRFWPGQGLVEASSDGTSWRLYGDTQNSFAGGPATVTFYAICATVT